MSHWNRKVTLSAKRPKIRIDENSFWNKPKAKEKWQELTSAINSIENYNCQDKPELWSDSPQHITEQEAEILCYKCPLLKQCYDYAVTAEVAWGVWGGVNFTNTTEIEELF